MDSLETDDQLIIVNRSMEHRISKQLIRKIPYFQKMLSHECLESKENKVELDFDEKVFEIIIDCIERGYTIIDMDYVINLGMMADYLGIERISKECITYFHDNFSIEQIPAVIPQVTSTSKCINTGALNAFICRYFLKIANIFAESYHHEKAFWLNYPIETIEYICALDLMIYSEIQVFNAIMRWIRFKVDTRKDHLVGLLKLVRWCHLNDEDLSKIKKNALLKGSGFEPIFCTPRKVNCDCKHNRTKQNYFIMIEECNGTDLRVKVLDNKFMQLINRVMKLDESMSLQIFHGEHISDILFDSGRKVIRIDWNQNKYKLFDSFVSYYEALHALIIRCDYTESNGHEEIINAGSHRFYGCSFFEANEKFISILGNKVLFYSLTPKPESIKKSSNREEILATILDNNIYMVSSDLEFIEFKIDSFDKLLKRTYVHHLWSKKFNFGNLLLTSSPAYDDRVILVDKITKDFFIFNINTQKWSSAIRMANCFSDDKQEESNKLFTFTSAFIPWNMISTCSNLKPSKRCKSNH